MSGLCCTDTETGRRLIGELVLQLNDVLDFLQITEYMSLVNMRNLI